MSNYFSITPPTEVVQQWNSECKAALSDIDAAEHIATQAARWGADQELEACCEWLQDPDLNVDTCKLRATRRPKPPSLRKQALAVLDDCTNCLDGAHENVLRRALESLDD